MERVVRTLLIAVGLALVPGTAYATNVSSNDGSGDQHLTAEYSNGWRATGTLRSTRGDPVYYSGKIVFNFSTDEYCGRYTGDVKQKYAVAAGGTCTVSPGIPSADAAEYRVCKNVNNLPDPCGAWSAREDF